MARRSISLSRTVLPTPRRAGEEDTFLWALFLDAAEKNAGLLEDSGAADELGRWRAGTGRKWVFDGVHTCCDGFLVNYTYFY